MEKRQQIDEFFAAPNFAVVGVSRNKNKFGTVIYREFKNRGLNVFPVNPAMETIAGDKCYPTLGGLPEKVEGVIVVVSPEKSEAVVKDAWEAGITKVWMQQGSQSDEALAFCREKGMTAIAKECVFMYCDPVQSIHRFHRGLAKLFGKYHK